jgi:hypothetical protein
MDVKDMLLPGEALLTTVNANALLGFSLSEKAPQWVTGDITAIIATLQSLWKLTSGGAIAGELHLTSYRLLFLSRGFNLQDGTFSVFLPALQSDQNLDGWISDQLTLNTTLSTHRFVVRDGEKLTASIHDAQRRSPPAKDLAKIVLDNLGKLDAAAARWKGDPGSTLTSLREDVEGGKVNALLGFAVTNLAELVLIAGNS